MPNETRRRHKDSRSGFFAIGWSYCLSLSLLFCGSTTIRPVQSFLIPHHRTTTTTTAAAIGLQKSQRQQQQQQQRAYDRHHRQKPCLVPLQAAERTIREEQQRAGTDGYSVLRQPARILTEWDSNDDDDDDDDDYYDDDVDETSGTMMIPLDPSQEGAGTSTSAWNRRPQREQQQRLGRFGPTHDKNWWQSQHVAASSVMELDNNVDVDDDEDEDEEVNLFRRTVHTLDIPRVFAALEEYCTTVPAIRLVREAVTNLASDSTSTSNGQHHKEEDERAYQPLVADSAEGAQERYQAVREMEWLMRGDEGLRAAGEAGDFDDLSMYTYRSCHNNGGGGDGGGDGGDGGELRSIAGSPPPLAGHSFDAESLLSAITSEGRVMTAREVLDVSEMLSILQNVRAWSHEGLAQVLRDDEGGDRGSDEHQQQHGQCKFVELIKIADSIRVNSTLAELLGTAMDEDGRLSGTTFPLLGELRAKIRQTKAQMKNTVDQVLALPSIRSKLDLQSGGPLISQIRGHYLVIPIQSKHVADLTTGGGADGGRVHDTSRSGKTAYVEPGQLVEPTRRLKGHKASLRAAKAAIWRMLTTEVLSQRRQLETSCMAAGQLDLIVARYRLGKAWHELDDDDDGADDEHYFSGCRRRVTIPEVGTEGGISLSNVKHPVLLLKQRQQQQHKKKKTRTTRTTTLAGSKKTTSSSTTGGGGSGSGAAVVGSDVHDFGLRGNQGLVLTGPNAGGKTVILKLLGLVAIMARAAIPLPADNHQKLADSSADHDDDSDDNQQPASATTARPPPRVDFFDPILADIGDLQSVGSDLSTFSGHLLVCRRVLEKAGKNALVLMDELGSGTDPAQGVALAQAVLESLVDTGARVAITTHYMQLKQLAVSSQNNAGGGGDGRFSVAGMQFVQGRPTYRLLPGNVGESFALAVAERLDLPSSVIDRAKELLDTETRQMGDLIRDMEDQKVLMDRRGEELEQKRKDLAALEIRMKQEQIRLEKKQLTARREEAKKFAKKLEEKESVLEDILTKLRSDPSRKVVAKSWDEIKFVKRDALDEAENVPSVLKAKRQQAAAAERARSELVPLAEMRQKPALQAGDQLVVCQAGALFGKQVTVLNARGGRVQVIVDKNMNMSFKLTQVALPPPTDGGGTVVIPATAATTTTGISASSPPVDKKRSISKRAERAIRAEQQEQKKQSANKSRRNGKQEQESSPSSDRGAGAGKMTMRTASNTVDVRGCTLPEAQAKAKETFSACLLRGRSVVYILHGHGTGGVLKQKVRSWLASERSLVKKFKSADQADGGDAFTCVELR